MGWDKIPSNSIHLSVKYGSEILFFVFVRNAKPKTEMEDTNKSGSSSPNDSPLRIGRCPLPTM